jgi:hypothetical protein
MLIPDRVPFFIHFRLSKGTTHFCLSRFGVAVLSLPALQFGRNNGNARPIISDIDNPRRQLTEIVPRRKTASIARAPAFLSHTPLGIIFCLIPIKSI